MKKLFIFLFVVMFFVGCSSDTKSVKDTKEFVNIDRYNYDFNYNPSLKEIILNIIFIFETNPNTSFDAFYYDKTDGFFKIYYYDSKKGRSWNPSIFIEKINSQGKNITVLNLFLTNTKENPEIKIQHNENIVINRQNYKEYESQILFLFKEYLSFLEKQINDRNSSAKETLKELSSIPK